MSRRVRFLGLGLAALGAAFGSFVLAAGAERWMWRDRVLPGVRLAGVEVAGRPLEDARRAIARRAAEMEGGALVATAGGHRFTFTPAEVGLEVDERAALAAVVRAGRQGSLAAQLAGVVSRRLHPLEVPWHSRYDQAKLDETVDTWAALVDTPPVDGGLSIEGGEVKPVASRPGWTLLRSEARALVARALRAEAASPLRLPVNATAPVVGDDEVARAAAEARRVLAGPADVVVEDRTVRLSPARLGRMLEVVVEDGRLRVGLLPEALHEELSGALSGLEFPPTDARFVVEGDPPVVRIEPSATGRGFDAAPVAEALLRGERRVAGRLRDVPPALDTEKAHALRIIEPVSSFTTEFPAGQPRVQNIHRIADLLQDTLIPPGERFSLNQAAGPRTGARGFVRAPVIYDGVFTQDVGGGVSQFATTFFNAAFFGGYKIVAHRPHSYYISRYPMGREATISFPEPDLVIENDSASGILVRTSYTSSSVTVTFFGDREGRSVRAEEPRVGRRSAGGYRVEVVRVIDRPDRESERQHFVTHYRTRPRRAPSTRPRPPQPPPPAETPTEAAPASPSHPA